MTVITLALQALGLGILLTTIYTAYHVFYNLFFHPLRHFPGPLFMRAGRAGYCYKLVLGTLSFEMLDLHRKYGRVVRIAPDELAICDASAWKIIFSSHKAGGSSSSNSNNHKNNVHVHAAGQTMPSTVYFEKSETFYNSVTGMSRDIIAAPEPHHSALRKQLSSGFSERALREQQPIIMKYVDLFIQRLKEHHAASNASSGSPPAVLSNFTAGQGQGQQRPIDVSIWYNYCTFDIIGDLAFGEPFGCLDSCDYHPWVRTVFQMVRVGVALQTANYYSWLRVLITTALSTEAMRKRRAEHKEMTMQKVLRRIELGKNGPRSDLVEGLLKVKEEWNLSLDEIEANSSLLIIAGSETTATALAGATYLLLKNPDKMRKLTDEVRTMFPTEQEIDIVSVNKLTYMLACLDETLRMYPPIPIGLPRVVPEGGATIAGRYIPEHTIVSIHQWATYHNERNFKNPFKFHPERFLGDPEYTSDKREALQPFHMGPRNCLGRNLAYIEMRLILARILWNFDLVLDDDSKDWMETQKIYFLWARGPLNVYLKPVLRGEKST